MPRALTSTERLVTQMTVLLVLATFLVFIVLDYVMNRGKVIVTVPVFAAKAIPAHFGNDYVDGFHVPQSLTYHPGHSWLVKERKNVVRVGVDEFAAALLGKIERIELPKPGQWIRQGQKVVTFFRDGKKTEMVSPTEGEVMGINAEIMDNPSILRTDPYGKGWLVSVHVPDEETPPVTSSPPAWCPIGCATLSSASTPSSPPWPAQSQPMADVPAKTSCLLFPIPIGPK